MNLDSRIKFMSLALEQAKEANQRGDIPIGAVLVIDGKVVGQESNHNRTNEDYNSHAESTLIVRHSKEIYKANKDDRRTELFTTLEPCIMCFGTSVMNRIDNIVYACPDPNGGISVLNIRNLPRGYSNIWPNLEQGPFREESYNLLIEHMDENDQWERVMEVFKQAHTSW